MVARLWFAHATPANCSHYLKHFSDEVLPALRGLDGFVSFSVLTRSVDDEVEILVTTNWHSMESIHAFTGPDCSVAVVAPSAAALLLSFDKRVQHFKVELAGDK